MSTARCPTCSRPFDPAQSKALPFCSQRCKEMDLGRWLGETYSFPVDPEKEESESPADGHEPPDEQ